MVNSFVNKVEQPDTSYTSTGYNGRILRIYNIEVIGVAPEQFPHFSENIILAGGTLAARFWIARLIVGMHKKKILRHRTLTIKVWLRAIRHCAIGSGARNAPIINPQAMKIANRQVI